MPVDTRKSFGQGTHVWGDNWILDNPPNYRVDSTINLALHVSDLINTATGLWDSNKVLHRPDSANENGAEPNRLSWLVPDEKWRVHLPKWLQTPRHSPRDGLPILWKSAYGLTFGKRRHLRNSGTSCGNPSLEP